MRMKCEEYVRKMLGTYMMMHCEEHVRTVSFLKTFFLQDMVT